MFQLAIKCLHLRASQVAVAAAVAALIAPAYAGANHVSSDMSASVGGPVRLVSGVYMNVPVTVSCPALQAPWTGIFSDSISISVTQRVGKTIARGFDGITYQSPVFNGVGIGEPVTCDGNPQTYTLTVYPAEGRPFTGGRAVATAYFQLGLYDPDNPFGNFDQNDASSGSQSISVRGG